MKLLSAAQLKFLDQATIEQKPIASLELMEKASSECAKWILNNIDKEKFIIFAGKGNNGGDGLAIARLLFQQGKEVSVFIVENSSRFTADCQTNLQRLPKEITLNYLTEKHYLLENFDTDAVIVDAIFGLGLSRELPEWIQNVLQWLNKQNCQRITIDLPSGMFADPPQSSTSTIFKADFTLTFHKPKINMFLPSVGNFVGKIIVLDISLLKELENQLETNYYLHDFESISPLYNQRQPRLTFSHKGTYGHALLVVGSYGKGGAAVLASQACMRSGVGLLSVLSPRCNYVALQTNIPETMFVVSENETHISDFSFSQDFQAIGIGCGIGTHPETQMMLKNLLQQSPRNIVLDADALNILAQNPAWLELLPASSILTPHPKEFARLVGSWQDDAECMNKMRDFAQKYKCYLLLKGAFSRIATPEGNIYFNPTGNPAMASAGMGDVLTGIVTALLAQEYSPYESLSIGVFAHGLAADLFVENTQSPYLLASDLISYLGKAFAMLKTIK